MKFSTVALVAFLLLLAGATLPGQALRVEYFTVNDGLSHPDINHLHIGSDGFLWVSTPDGLNRFDGRRFRRVAANPASGPTLSRNAVSAVAEDQEGRFVVTFQNFLGYFDRYDPVTGGVDQVRLVPSTGVSGYPRTIITDPLGRTFVVAIGPVGTILYEYTPNRGDDLLFTQIYRDSTDAWTTLAPRVELLALDNGQFLIFDEEHGLRHLSANGKLLYRAFSAEPVRRRLYAMEQAADGLVYLSFANGTPLFYYDPAADTGPVPVPGADRGLHYPTIYRDGLGQLLLVGTEDFLGDRHPTEYYVVDTLGRFQFFDPLMPTDRAITALATPDVRRTTYLGLRDGLGIIDRRNSDVRNYLSAASGERRDRRRITAVESAADSSVYLLTDLGRLHVRLPGQDEPRPVTLVDPADSTREIRFRGGGDLLAEPQTGMLWISGQDWEDTRKGVLLRYNTATGSVVRFVSEYPLGKMARGPDGELYVAASSVRHTGLLLRWDAVREQLEICEDDKAREVGGMKINALVAAGGRLLIGTEGKGLLSYDPGRAVLTPLRGSTLAAEDAAAALAPIEGHSIYDIYARGVGDWWVGTDVGLYRYRPGEGWLARYGRAEGLSANVIMAIVPAAGGGFWLSTNNGLVRIPADLDPDDFRRYYEEDGLASNDFFPGAALRAPDGAYFFGHDNGVTVFYEDDFSARSAGADVILTEIQVYGKEEVRSITRNLRHLRQVTLATDEKSIAISFALPAGQAPGKSRFRYRLEGFNDDWVALLNEQTIRFNNLESGSYRLRIQGAGANGNFGEGETMLILHVRQSILEKFWFQATLIATFAGLIFYIVITRLRGRLYHERLRTQLSADIHDEVSGLLAGISMQTDLLQNKTDDERMRKRLARVGEASRSAMSKLSDVIWSFDSRRDTIGNLAQRMQEHADEVLLPLDIRYTFRAEGLDIERQLPGGLRQDLYFIYKEAVNNIARHREVANVSIKLEQTPQFFELLIQDDGIPRSGTSGRKTGQGRENMRMRADRLKAELVVDQGERGGVVLRMRRL